MRTAMMKHRGKGFVEQWDMTCGVVGVKRARGADGDPFALRGSRYEENDSPVGFEEDEDEEGSGSNDHVSAEVEHTVTVEHAVTIENPDTVEHAITDASPPQYVYEKSTKDGVYRGVASISWVKSAEALKAGTSPAHSPPLKQRAKPFVKKSGRKRARVAHSDCQPCVLGPPGTTLRHSGYDFFL